MPTYTFYPDPNVETTSVDGLALHQQNVAWATLVAAAGSDHGDAEASEFHCEAKFPNSSLNRIIRSFFLFDTSSITDTDTITSATLSTVNTAVTTSGGAAGQFVNVFSSNPASNTDLVNGDYDAIGSTAFSTEVGLGSINTDGSTYNDFELNASGLAAITVSGVSKFSIRIKNDYGSIQPNTNATGNSMSGYFADQTGTSTDPKLVVNTTAAGGSTFTPKIIIM